MSRFSQEVDDVLRRAGWMPGRQADLTRWKGTLPEFEWHGAAEKFLREFGGIRVVVEGFGVKSTREPFEFDPDVAFGEEERFVDLSALYGRKFFPVGEFGQGEFFLAIDEDSVVYLVARRAWRYSKVDQALDQLVTGVAPEKLIPSV